jgi:1-deoxy-D-xylulose-5-phosphate synthase
VLLIGVGALAGAAVAAAEQLAGRGVPAAVVDPGWLLPVDPALVEAAGRHRLVVTVEDSGVAGGYGDAFCRAVRAARVPAEVCTLGLPQQFLGHGERDDLLAAAGLDAAGISSRVQAELGSWRQDSRRASAR